MVEGERGVLAGLIRVVNEAGGPLLQCYFETCSVGISETPRTYYTAAGSVPLETPLRASVLLSMLGADFAVAVASPKRVNHELFPEELWHIAHAVEKRQAEFGTARVCARRALAQLGIAPCPLVPNADRSPRWPLGIMGSISHTHRCCAVAVTNSPHVAGVGLDLELDVPLQPELERMICRPAERLWLDGCDREKRGLLGKLFFSAKEAFYKCQYQTTQTLLDFQDVELNIDLESGRFSAVEITQRGAQWDLVGHAIGKFRYESGFIVTTAVLNRMGNDRINRSHFVQTHRR